jgi:hypothetical protein
MTNGPIGNSDFIEPNDLRDQPVREKSHSEIFNDALASNDETRIVRTALMIPRLKPDQKLAIYDKAKELRSNRLMNLVKQLSLKESAIRIVEDLLKRDERQEGH